MRAAFSAAASVDIFGTVVGLPHVWQFNVMPAAAASTTNEVEQCEQAKTMSLLGFSMELLDAFAVCIGR